MIYMGDSLEVLKTLPENSVDAVVTDPPYGWRFMGKAWDGADIELKMKQSFKPNAHVSSDGVQIKPRVLRAEAAGKYEQTCGANKQFGAWTELWAKEVFRVLKPGGHMLVFCGPRTYHRMASGVEDAGFEIRDQLQWIFGSGFPKSHNIGEGRGTALKPANEPIVLARKPLSESTVAKNVLKWGTGALNIDGSRIGTEQIESGRAGRKNNVEYGSVGYFEGLKGQTEKQFSQGRWPANVIFDEAAAEMLDAQSGVSKSPTKVKQGGSAFGSGYDRGQIIKDCFGDSGGASRFFYCAKASKSERNKGLEGMPEKEKQGARPNSADASGKFPDHDHRLSGGNSHPTVKPIRLMEYLCKLITPPGGVVLDPFMGSGSTGVAAKNLGFEFIGIEMNEEYVEIARKRVGE